MSGFTIEGGRIQPDQLPEGEKSDKASYLLTPKEREVLVHAAPGLAYSEIKMILGISPSTVHTHMNDIAKKLDLIVV